MKNIIKILRNQAIDPADQKLINHLRNEAKRERLNDSISTEFKIGSITQDSSIFSQNYGSKNKSSQLKLIYTFGFAVIVIILLSIIPESKLRFLIPGEQEKLDQQLQAWNEVKQLHDEIQTSLTAYKRNLRFDEYEGLKINWNDNFLGVGALFSLTEIKNEFLHISPFDNVDLPGHGDFEFLYKKEWDIIKESFLNSDLDS